MKATRIALAILTLAAASPAFAIVEFCDDCTGGGGWAGGGYVPTFQGQVSQWPQVDVTGDKWWWGGQIQGAPAGWRTLGTPISFGGTSPGPGAPIPPKSATLTPEEQKAYDDAQKACRDKCDAMNTMNQATCVEASSGLRFRLYDAGVPLPFMATAALTAAFLGKTPAERTAAAVAAGVSGYAAGAAWVENRVNQFDSQCKGLAARDLLRCYSGWCNAWFMMPLLFLRHRREDETPALA